MQIIKITNVERKEGTSNQGPWVNTTVTGEKGLKASTFEPNDLKKGDVIEAELVKDGIYLKLKSFKKMNNQSQNVKPAPARSPEPTKDEMIQEQVAVKIASDLLCAKVINLDNEFAIRMTVFLDKHLPK